MVNSAASLADAGIMVMFLIWAGAALALFVQVMGRIVAADLRRKSRR